VWLAQDNIATSVYIPVYCGATDLPESYKTPGRIDGFTRESAWWAFNRLSTLTTQRWGDMRHDVDAVLNPLQEKLFEQQNEFEQKALSHKGKKRIELITEYTIKLGNTAVQKAWKTGDFLWTKYDEKF
ncbi:MAG: peptidase C69, partial [Bacteroidetes bacterium]